MKGKLLLGFLSLISLLFIVIAFVIYSYKSNRESYFRNFPEVVVSDLFFRSVNLGEHATDAASVLIYFNSSCPICQSEAQLIERSFREDTLTRFLWVSSESVEEVKNFTAQYNLDSLDTHRFYSDTLFRLASAFRLTGVPASFVYDGGGHLVDYTLGAVAISDLTLSIQKAHDRTR
ncbi:TlpA family protein disulfide reductase [Algoriphagus sp.]|uniref:TlpA family protein disulfide reductase n=1 Tax=Algoriphagus sp. TaxID=1872435 RepID=UPI003918A413